MDTDPDSHFDELTSFLECVGEAIPEGDPDLQKIASGRRAISPAVDEINASRDPDAETRLETPVGKSSGVKTGVATIFDDVDE